MVSQLVSTKDFRDQSQEEQETTEKATITDQNTDIPEDAYDAKDKLRVTAVRRTNKNKIILSNPKMSRQQIMLTKNLQKDRGENNNEQLLVGDPLTQYSDPYNINKTSRPSISQSQQQLMTISQLRVRESI